MIAVGALLAIRPGGDDVTRAVIDVLEILAAASAALAAAHTARRSPGRAKPAWALLGAGAASWGAGQTVWTVYEVSGREAPFPSAADIGFLLAIPLLVAGLLSLPVAHHREHTRRLADALVVAGSLLATGWSLVIGHVAQAASAGSASVLALAYPVGDVVLIIVVVSLLSQAAPAWRRPLAVLGAGLVCITVADGGFAYFTATHSFVTGGLFDLGWIAGYGLLGLGALEAPLPGTSTDLRPTRTPMWTVNLPYTPAALMVVVVAATSARNRHVDGTAAAMGALVLLLLLARQVLVHSANLGLTARLDRQRSVLLSVLHSLGEGVVVADEDGNLMLFNAEAEPLLSTGTDRPPIIETPLARAISGKATNDMEMRVTRPGELTERTIVATGRPVRDHDGGLRGGVVVLRDETKRREAEAALRDREAQLAAAQQLAAVGSWEIDLTTGVSVWSDEQYRLLGYEPGAVPPDPELFFEHVLPEYRAAARAATQHAFDYDGEFSYRCQVETADGRQRWLEIHGRIERDHSTPGAGRVTGMAQDITDRIDAEETLRRQATEDALTRLPNRAQLGGAVAERLGRRRPGEGVALLLMDLDRFKEVNDSMGHEVGDRVLIEVADRLRRAVRTSDVVTRLGGDEFAIVVSDLPDETAAGTVAGTLIQILDEPVELDGVTVPLGASIGIAYAPGHGEDSNILLQKADVAMYRAKRHALGWAMYGPGDDQDRLARLALLADLRGGLDRGEVLVHYQPQVDLRTGQTRVVEALARWNHPRLGMVPPGQFVALAEQTGLIRPLTAVVLRQALAQCVQWRAEGLDVGVAVNLSPHTLLDPDLAPTIDAALRDARLPASVLTLEITESAFADSTTEVIRMLEDLRDLGVRLCIDDFGTGYSSMAYLKHLPVDELKIDRAFVFELDTDSRDVSIVRAILELAHSLGLSVVADGVDSESAGRILTALRCDVAQGYGLCRPGPPSEITGWLAERAHAGEAAPYSASSPIVY